MNLEYLFYTIFILVNTIIVWEDFKTKKIKNKYILILLAISILFLWYEYNLIHFDVISMIYKISLSFAISFFLWLVGFWPAGDSKLFIVWSIFLSPILSSTAFEVNVFFPIFFIFIPIVALKTNKKKVIESLKKTFDGYRMYLIFTVFFGFSWVLMQIFNLLNVPSNFIFYFIVAFILIEFVSRIAPFSLEVFYFILCLIRIFLDPTIYTLSFWVRFFEMIFTYTILVFFFLELASDINTQTVKIDRLKPGMVLVEGIVEEETNGKKIYKKSSIPMRMLVRKKNFIHNTSDDGLTKEDVERIKKLYKDGKIKFSEIKVHKSMPFAIFILFGGIMSIVLKNSITDAIKFLYLHLSKV